MENIVNFTVIPNIVLEINGEIDSPETSRNSEVMRKSEQHEKPTGGRTTEA